MRASFTPPKDLTLEGDASELAELRLVLEDGLESALHVKLKPHDPKPYDQALEDLVVQVANGPTVVAISGSQLSIAGARENIERFASFLNVLPGEHGHYECYPGNEWIDDASVPVVICCSS